MQDEGSDSMSFKTIREQQEEIYREEQILNFCIELIPILYIFGMLFLNIFLPRYGEHLHGDEHLLPSGVRVRGGSHRGYYSLQSIIILCWSAALLLPIPPIGRAFSWRDDWNTVDHWNIGIDKKFYLAGAVICSGIMLLIASPSIRGSNLPLLYTLMFLIPAFVLAVLGYIFIRWAISRKLYDEVALSYNLQIATRVLYVGSFIATFLSIPLLFYLFPA